MRTVDDNRLVICVDDLYARFDEVGKAAIRWKVLCGEPLRFSLEWVKERLMNEKK